MVCLGRVLPRHCNEIRGAVLDHSELIAFLGFQSWDRKACQYGSLAHLSVARTHLGGAVAPLRSDQVFFLGGVRDWPPFERDSLYAETDPFGLSAFGFLASRLPLCCPFAIASSLSCWIRFLPSSFVGHHKNLAGGWRSG